MDDIDDWRTRIDALDAKIVELLNERAKCAIAIGKIKADRGMRVHNPEREKIVLDRVREHNRGPLDHGAVQRIFRQIIEECRRTEITAP
jgi:chorismate mutase-like protein